MPIVTDNYRLSLTQDDRVIRIRCSQNDTSRQVNFTIYNNGMPFNIPSGLSVSVRGIKQNGNIFSKSCMYSGSVVTLVLGSQITNVAGISVAELVFTDSSGGKIGTSNFIFQVESDPLLRGKIDVAEETPTEYISDLVLMIEALSARVNNIVAPEGEASLSEVVDARTSGYSGTIYQNLKSRLDADFAAVSEIQTDNSLNENSNNPVQNKVITQAINNLNSELGQRLPLSYADAETIPANSDLNDYTTIGSYKVTTLANARTIINIPDQLAGRLIVLTTASSYQTLQIYITNQASGFKIFYRSKTAGDVSTFSQWYLLSNTNNIENAVNTLENELQQNVSSLNDKIDSTFDSVDVTLSSTSVPSWRMVNEILPISEINDSYNLDGVNYNQVQGIASDGKRYLFWGLRAGSVEYGDSHAMLIRKWDTWKNESAGINIAPPQPYGHGEDMEFIPYWCKGFDNGNVDRLYIIDMERYSTGRTIHVVNANTLEYITSFETTNLSPSDRTEYWEGAGHVMFNPKRGKIVLNSIHTDSESVKRNILAIYNHDGTYEKGVIFNRRSGTQLGCFCDENYIYITRYVSSEGGYNNYLYILDWDLNPKNKILIPETYWEWEGICSIGENIYTSWIADGVNKGVKIVKNRCFINDYAIGQQFPLSGWSSTDGFVLSSFQQI